MTYRQWLATSAIFVTIIASTSVGWTQTAGGEIELVGRYSNVRYTGEHAYGYQLQLWRDGRTLDAIWFKTDGLPTDFPAVRATNIVLADASGLLRFSAKWCDELQVFEGVLENGRIKGTLTTERPTTPRQSINVDLIKEPEDPSRRPRASWNSLVDRILTARAPKCPSTK